MSTLGLMVANLMVVITDNASAVAVICLLYIVCFFLLYVCVFGSLVSSILCLFVYCYFMFYYKKLLFINYHFPMSMRRLLRYSNMFLFFYLRICFSFFLVWITFCVFMSSFALYFLGVIFVEFLSGVYVVQWTCNQRDYNCSFTWWSESIHHMKQCHMFEVFKQEHAVQKYGWVHKYVYIYIYTHIYVCLYFFFFLASCFHDQEIVYILLIPISMKLRWGGGYYYTLNY